MMFLKQINVNWISIAKVIFEKMQAIYKGQVS